MNKNCAPESIESLLLRLHADGKYSGDTLNELYAQLRTSHTETIPATQAYHLTGSQENPLPYSRFDVASRILTPAASMASDDYAVMEVTALDTKARYEGSSSSTYKQDETKTKKSKKKNSKANRENKQGLSYDGPSMNGISRADCRAKAVELDEGHDKVAALESGVDENIGGKPTGEPLEVALIMWYSDGRVCARSYKGPLPEW